MEQDKEKTPPSSAGCDTDRCEERDNSAQKDEINEERKDSLFGHEEGQRSIREEQETADCTFDPVEIAKRLREVYDGLDPAAPTGPLTDSAPFLTEFKSNVKSHNSPKIGLLEKETELLEHTVLEKQNYLTILRERIRRRLEHHSPAFSGPSSSAHLSSLSECTDTSDMTPSYSPHDRSLTNILREVQQKDEFSVQSQSEPGVDHSFEGEMGSPVTAEQSLSRKKTAADESKPQSKVSLMRPVTSAKILRDTLKDSTPRIPVVKKGIKVVRVHPKTLVQTPPSSPVHPPYAFYQSPLSVSPPSYQRSFIHTQSEKEFSEDEVQVKPSSQSVDSLPYKSSSPSDSFIYGLHHDYGWETQSTNPIQSSPYHHHHHHHHHQQQQQQQQQQLKPISKTIIPPVTVFPQSRRVVPQGPSTAEKQTEQTFPIKMTIKRLLPEPFSAAISRNVKSLQTSELEMFLTNKISILKGQVRNLQSLINEEKQCLKWLQQSKTFSHRNFIHSRFPSHFPVEYDYYDHLQRDSSGHSFTKEKEIKKRKNRERKTKSSNIASTSPDDILDRSPPALTETGMKNKSSSAAGDTTAVSQDDTGEMECVTGPSTPQPSTSNDDDSDSSLLADAFSLWSLQPESESGGDRDANVETETFVTAVNLSATNTLPTHSPLLQTPDCFRSRRTSSIYPRSHSVSSLSQTGSAENKILTRTKSLPNMLLKSSVVEFTPDITDDGNDESYRFLCSCPGLYQCSVTGLVFHMDGEGEVVYRIVPWNRRLLAQHHKQPAGPLFDIKCLQQSVCQLHLPHCEIRSTGGCEFLSVAHVHDEGIEFIGPHQVTDTHVIINITGFSGFGNVKDEDSPPDPVRALVLLFYKPPAAPDVTSVLSVLMLPRNVVLREVQRIRKKLVGDENYIDRSPQCKLHPQQEYTLSTCPEDESVLVQPKTAEFECENYDNYFSTFQVDMEQILKHINLFLRDSNKHSVWERRVGLSSTGVKRSCVQGESTERLLEIRSSFIDGISGPVLKDLLDKLFEKTVITDSEREEADAIQVKSDKARFVIDTVRKKGEAASSEMIEYLCKIDTFLCEHLGLL